MWTAGVLAQQEAEHTIIERHRTGKKDREETVVFVFQMGN